MKKKIERDIEERYRRFFRKFTDPLSHRGIKRKKEERYDLRSR